MEPPEAKPACPTSAEEPQPAQPHELAEIVVSLVTDGSIAKGKPYRDRALPVLW
jgi:hypothetical protein